MLNYRGNRAGGTGWDFSAYLARPWANAANDVVYSDTLGYAEIYAADLSTDIQDMGFHDTLDAIDYAPPFTAGSGWSPTGTVEAIPGHCYIVHTRDDHFAKFRLTGVAAGSVTFDWAYQTDTANRELKVKPAGHPGANPLQAAVTQR
jgi:hypothetical protein